jgi:hypothetical protein
MAGKSRHRTEATLAGLDSLRCEEQTRDHDGFAADLLVTWEAPCLRRRGRETRRWLRNAAALLAKERKRHWRGDGMAPVCSQQYRL